jgi:hypothetical protein
MIVHTAYMQKWTMKNITARQKNNGLFAAVKKTKTRKNARSTKKMTCCECIHEKDDRCQITDDWIFECNPEECGERVVRDDKERNAAEDP